MTFKERLELADTWKEKVEIFQLYHLMKTYKDKDWRIQDTADYFGVSKSLISENLWLAEQMEIVGECASRSKALMMLRRNNDA